MLLLTVLQGLAQEGQWSLGIKLCCVFEREFSRKLVDEALLLRPYLPQSTVHQDDVMTISCSLAKMHGSTVLFLKTKLLKLTGQVIAAKA